MKEFVLVYSQVTGSVKFIGLLVLLYITGPTTETKKMQNRCFIKENR